MRFRLATNCLLLICAAADCLALPALDSSLSTRASATLAKRAAFDDHFWVRPGQWATGGCFDEVNTQDSNDKTTWKDKLDKAREEALTIADGAVDALSMLLKDKPRGDDEAKKWEKARKSLFDLFAIKVDDTQKPTADVEQAINKILRNFKKFADSRNAAPKKFDKNKPRIYCGDEGFTWVEPNKESPGAEKEKAGPDGAWFLRGYADKKKTKSIPEELMSLGPNGSRDRLYTMVFCKKSLEYPTTQKELKKTVKEGSELTEVRSLSRTFLHESLHLEAELRDLNAVKLNKAGDAPAYGKDGKTVQRTKKKVYGYQASYNLARFVPSVEKPTPDGPINTVETYVYFATSMFHEEWFWEGEKGTAAKSTDDCDVEMTG